LISAAFYKIASSSPSKSYTITNAVFKTQFKISLFSGAVLALLAYPLILGLYGAPYKDSILPLIILIPGIIAWSASKVVSNMLTYNLGMASFLAKASFLGCFLNILLNYVFIKLADRGISGAALASSLSYSVVAISIFIKARKTKTRLPPPT
jgi:O-antigen/teichoic acid export membrane protein